MRHRVRNVFYLLLNLGCSTWVRISSNFYRGIKRINNDGTISVYLNSPPAPRFLQTIPSDSLNFLVNDVSYVEYSKLNPSTRVIVEQGPDYSVLGIVVKMDAVKSQSNPKRRYRLTVRLDANGKDMLVETERVWTLPYQIKTHGKPILF